jgi:hypothetical protein
LYKKRAPVNKKDLTVKALALVKKKGALCKKRTAKSRKDLTVVFV